MERGKMGGKAWLLSGCLALVLLGAARGQTLYLPKIERVEDFELLSAPSTGSLVERYSKFLLPAADALDLLPPLFQNVNENPLHLDFLRDAFPERFGDLDAAGYKSLVERRATRRYYAGVLARIRTDGGLIYGFEVFTSPEESELLTEEEVQGVYRQLREVFLLEPLFYAPISSPSARRAAAAWEEPPFPVYVGGITTAVYQGYTLGTGYGRVRLLTPAQLEAAVSTGLLTWQDIVVLDEAPRDIEGVVAGVVTAEPQTDLSHLSIRMARRGTPNAYVKAARASFAALEGSLVRLEVEPGGYKTSPATPDEAEGWWASHRPKLSREPQLDSGYAGLDDLASMSIDGPTSPEARYGGKASNFARLQRILVGPFERYRETGLAIPCRYYLEFLRANTTASRARPAATVTLEEYIQELLAAPDFQSDSSVRAAELAKLRQLIDDGFVDPVLTSAIVARIGEVFGAAEVPVRFRSSSNVEDDLEFNGAGLYDSTSACAADDLDADGDGPSICDPAEDKERRIGRALRKVWQSLWNFRAFEERAYYQIPQDRVAMAVLVSRAYRGELANAVAFTGIPTSPLDPRYVVTAQVGEESVVSPQPGVRAERTLLEVTDGVVRRIERRDASTLVAPGEVVFSDARLEEVAALLWHIHESFPVDLGSFPPERVIFDTELKVNTDGTLSIKQVRPFLLAEATDTGPTFELVIPQDLSACGVFADGRSPRGEYEAKSRLRFISGTHLLTAGRPIFPGDLIEELVLGPRLERAEPALAGRFHVETKVAGDGVVKHSFSYEETFRLASGETFELELSLLDFRVAPGAEPPAQLVLDEAYLIDQLYLVGRYAEDPAGTRQVRYSSCGYESLPLWRGRVQAANGDVLGFEERFRDTVLSSGPANLVKAELEVGGETRVVEDYFHLVYAAEHHNENIRYWILLEPPIDREGVGPTSVLEVVYPDLRGGAPAQLSYLDASYRPLATVEVDCFRKALPGEEVGGCGFRRGDVNSSGLVNLTDPINLLAYLFQGGAAPTCLDAADFDDDRSVEITDAILILSFLFQGVDLSAPPGPFTCGIDPTPDALGECLDRSCQ